MRAIDRLGWAAGGSFTAYGVRFGVRVSEREVLDHVADHLPPLCRPAPSDIVERLYSLVVGGIGPQPNIRRFNLLYANATRLTRTLELQTALEAFGSDLQLYVAESSPRRLFVHSGVVGWRGQAILFPGRSFSGKSSLAAELVKAGATYYSDEYAVLDARGRIHPYPRPLSERETGRSGKSIKYSPEMLGGRSGVHPLPAGLVVVTRYRPGARWRPRRLSTGAGVLALLANTVSVRRQPERTMAMLRRVIEGTRVIQSSRGEACEIVESILASVG